MFGAYLLQPPKLTVVMDSSKGLPFPPKYCPWFRHCSALQKTYEYRANHLFLGKKQNETKQRAPPKNTTPNPAPTPTKTKHPTPKEKNHIKIKVNSSSLSVLEIHCNLVWKSTSHFPAPRKQLRG